MPVTFTPLPTQFYFLLEEQKNCVLLESSRLDDGNDHSYFFSHPEKIITAHRLDDIPHLFAEIEKSIGEGFFVAGYFAYECGYYFERVASQVPLHPSSPLAWFGVYRAPVIFNHAAGAFEGDPPAKSSMRQTEYSLKNCSLGISENEYIKKIETIKNYIVAGDTYQVNFTDSYAFDFHGSPAACFASLRERQKVGYSAFINADGISILSFSPELFFKIENGTIITKPMKGTAKRGRNLVEDAATLQWLHSDEKNRSENLMIVDLLRNDIGRIAATGSVEVKDMFTVEQYETLFQMTSTVLGRMPAGISYFDLFKSIFPSGSVTGAPKIRTMQIIHEIERRPRGIYTGAIGFIAPDRKAVFNVAIRTLVIDGDKGEMGVGSGIVFDSDAHKEYEECKLKAEFLTQPSQEFQLIESMLWKGEYPFIASHIERLRASAQYFDFTMNEKLIIDELMANEKRLRGDRSYKVRLILNEDGTFMIDNQTIADAPSHGKIILSSQKTSSQNKFLFHKTTHRELYESEFARASQHGYDDIIFSNEMDQITEGTINNIFIELSRRLFTPPITCGLLPGVYRRHLLDTTEATEKILSVDDLRHSNAIYLSNAVRGFRKVAFVE